MDKEDRNLYDEGYLDRVFQAFNGLRTRFHGPFDDMALAKASNIDTNIEFLVEALCRNEKYFAGKGPISKHLDVYSFLKLILERNAPLHEYEEYLFGTLGIKRDRFRLSLPQQNEISAQSVAQVLWYLEKNKIPSIDKMTKRLLDKTSPFNSLCDLSTFNPRIMRNWISEIFPVPKNLRRGRPRNEEIPSSLFNNLILIPGIFLDDGATVNFPKLQFTVTCITGVLQVLGWPLEEIIESEPIDFYTSPFRLTFFPVARFLINDWVREAFLENGSILGP